MVWLSAYGLQEFNDMAKVHPIDRNVIERTQRWLMAQRGGDGSWGDLGKTHGETIERMGNTKLLLTSYVAWSLLDTGVQDKRLDKSIQYLVNHLDDAKDNAYILALTANALAAHDPKGAKTLEVLARLEKLKKDLPEWQACCYPTTGQSLCYSQGDSATLETTALAALAMLKTGAHTTSVNQALMYLVKSKGASGTWGSTQATILSLKALVAGMGGTKQEEKVDFAILVNGQEAAKGEVTPLTSDVLQLFDLKDHAKVGKNEVAIQVSGKTNMMYQIVGRHYEPWNKQPAAAKPVFDIAVNYDRTELTTADVLKAKATMRYNGAAPTYMVIVDLGIPPGFAPDAANFQRIVRKGEQDASPVEKFTLTPRQVTLYLGNVKPGDVLTFDYTLKPRFPVKVQTPATIAYEYYTPANRAATKPVELTVRDSSGR
jgi:hypothetical protein